MNFCPVNGNPHDNLNLPLCWYKYTFVDIGLPLLSDNLNLPLCYFRLSDFALKL